MAMAVQGQSSVVVRVPTPVHVHAGMAPQKEQATTTGGATPCWALAGAGTAVAAAAAVRRRAARAPRGPRVVLACTETVSSAEQKEKKEEEKEEPEQKDEKEEEKEEPRLEDRSARKLDATVQEGIGEAAEVFSWLNIGPPAGSPCYESLFEHFPGAMPGQAIHTRTRSMLEAYGFTPDNTIMGTSICPDEINNEKGDLVDDMKEHWGECFPLGGIGGAPFVGKTGFGAFSAHVPEDGNVLMVFGPHVAISETGEVGKYLRQGQSSQSTACGACIGAYQACCQQEGDDGANAEFDENDMQMAWIKRQVKKHIAHIREQENPMAALAYKSYDAVKGMILNVVNNDFGMGYLALIGGIQINMPKPYQDHFLLTTFEVRKKGEPTIDLLDEWYRRIPFRTGDLVTSEARNARMQHMVFSWLRWSPKLDSPAYNALHTHFPGALPGLAVHARMRGVIESEPFGLSPENTLVGTSVCPDEINHETGDVTDLLRDHWGACFPLGGISGSPFVGKTGFGAFSAHVPQNGNIIVFFGPHVAISESGEIGKYRRHGQSKESTACGAVIGAYCACCEGEDGSAGKDSSATFDMQMAWIKQQIAPHAARIRETSSPMAALAHQSYEMVQQAVEAIVDTHFGSGYLVLVGGVQINMPPPYTDHFLPCMFEIRRQDEAPQNMLQAMNKVPLKAKA